MKTENKDDFTLVTYRITIKGRLDAHWAEWFSDYVDDIMVPELGPARTVLTVRVPDQAALRGILNRIWDLNLILLSVIELGSNLDE